MNPRREEGIKVHSQLVNVDRDTFKYHVSCTGGKISVIIILITYFSTVVPHTSCVFFPVGLTSLTRHFQTGLVDQYF